MQWASPAVQVNSNFPCISIVLPAFQRQETDGCRRLGLHELEPCSYPQFPAPLQQPVRCCSMPPLLFSMLPFLISQTELGMKLIHSPPECCQAQPRDREARLPAVTGGSSIIPLISSSTQSKLCLRNRFGGVRTKKPVRKRLKVPCLHLFIKGYPGKEIGWQGKPKRRISILVSSS